MPKEEKEWYLACKIAFEKFMSNFTGSRYSGIEHMAFEDGFRMGYNAGKRKVWETRRKK